MKKGMKQGLDNVLNMPVPDKVAEQLRKFGIKDKDIKNETAIAVALYQQAVKGNVNAINTINKMTTDEIKKVENNKTKSYVKLLDNNEKIYELAKILSGSDLPSDKFLENAKELLNFNQ